MLAYFVVGIVAFLVSTLTLFTGFGLGTLLMPTFALFFPVEVAVAATAVVHGANSLFKAALLWRHAEGRVLVRFGIPALLMAVVGAMVLGALAGRQETWLTWQLGSRVAEITPLKAVMGGLILLFAMIDLSPQADRLRFPPRWLPLGGVLSGFFGGLSGHQGALRAAFLLPLGLTPAGFAGTQAVLAAMVDAARLAVYGGVVTAGLAAAESGDHWRMVAVAIPCAFAGALLGRRLLPNVTVSGLRWLTGTLLLLVGLGLASGLI